MKKILITLAAALIICSCGSDSFRIHGYVSDPALNGVQIFLVPLENAVKENIDSVVIVNQHFEFTGNVERLSDIRVDKYHRFGIQNLLVVTEPGDIFVTIGPDSSSYGTPQNDSLQVWKEMTVSQRQFASTCQDRELTKASRDEYRLRTQQMALGLGSGPLHDFLLKMFPVSERDSVGTVD